MAPTAESVKRPYIVRPWVCLFPYYNYALLIRVKEKLQGAERVLHHPHRIIKKKIRKNLFKTKKNNIAQTKQCVESVVSVQKCAKLPQNLTFLSKAAAKFGTRPRNRLCGGATHH